MAKPIEPDKARVAQLRALWAEGGSYGWSPFGPIPPTEVSDYFAAKARYYRLVRVAGGTCSNCGFHKARHWIEPDRALCQFCKAKETVRAHRRNAMLARQR